MLAIYVKEEKSRQRLYMKMAQSMGELMKLGLEATVEQSEENKMVLSFIEKDPDLTESYQCFLAALLTEDVLATYESGWLTEVASESYESCEEERKQIVAIAQSILNGDREDLLCKQLASNRCRALYKAFFQQLLSEEPLYYEAFLTFRIKEYTEFLMDCIELAIDEYCSEQEHQTTVDAIRQTVALQKTKRSVIYLVHNETFRIYDDYFRELTADECQFYITESLENDAFVGKMEQLILSLIEMSPEYIYVFTKQPDHHTILLIQTIYQERLKIYPLERYVSTTLDPV
ncbi:sporulation protein YtxC [Shouchella sp. JSM 1781072]|uniref:sporulation protein YtxC n=1 Tax=Bacillaceae TaxID=186817 RepID=UPI000C07F7A5|nr:sporulation protein YtxC [Bacillus sp. Marseille-P3800]